MISQHPAAIRSRSWRSGHSEESRAYQRAWARRKYATDDEYRAARKARGQTPEAKEKARVRSAERRGDPIQYEVIKARTRKSVSSARRDPARWSAYVIHGLKRRANAEGVPFNLVAADIPLPEKCPVFGVPLVFGFNLPFSPSVDRIRPALGYVKGNVRVISRRANAMKQDCESTNEVRLLLAYMVREGLT